MREEYDFTRGQRGAVLDNAGKTPVTLYLDDDLLAACRERAAASGQGYQSLINDTLRANLLADAAPLTEAKLRQVLHEMLPAA
ncbi:BrnA antitoxin family protein [Thiorhodovibrio litoralis]|uniref:BrnA antitoxin family protein n=1 Tax=Thiorhodovibrio litoralis TaxID=2952932 RepID=UPI002B259F9E|nr:BrnA antitoxin family protein [Thiorhodovibrio litoralis]WPL14177.1 hypothetical protein Thiosp_04010 [Thiorhodovibrio litoralis]